LITDRFRIDDQVAIITVPAGYRRRQRDRPRRMRRARRHRSRTASDLDEVAHVVEGLDRRAVSVACDLSDLSAIAELAAVARREFGRVDIVVNNVGGAVPLPFLMTTPQYMEEAFHFNVATAHALNLARCRSCSSAAAVPSSISPR